MGESFLGGGDLYIDRLTDAGASTGFLLTGNATKFEIKSESDIKEQTSKGRDTYGQVIATANLPKPSTIKITLNQLDPETMAMAFLGDKAALSVAGGSVADEAVTAKLDKWVDLAKRNIDDESVVVQDVTDTTTYVEGTDYEINYRLGMIKALSTGDISDGDVLHADYDHSAETGSEIEGATQPLIKAKLKLDGKNYVNGKNVLVNVYYAELKPSSAVDFLSDDFLPLELEGTLRTPDGKDHPFKVTNLD